MTSRPPYGPDSPLAWENYVVAQVAQAMLGLLSAEVTAVACRVGTDVIELHVVAAGDVDEDVEEICFELDVLLDGSVAVASEIYESPSALDWSDATLRGIYSAKPSEPSHS